MAAPAGSSSRQCQVMVREASDRAGPSSGGRLPGRASGRRVRPCSAGGGPRPARATRDPRVRPPDPRPATGTSPSGEGTNSSTQERAGHDHAAARAPGRRGPRLRTAPRWPTARRRTAAAADRPRIPRGEDPGAVGRCPRRRGRAGRRGPSPIMASPTPPRTPSTAPALASPEPRPRTAPTTAIVAARKSTAASSSRAKVTAGRPRCPAA